MSARTDEAPSPSAGWVRAGWGTNTSSSGRMAIPAVITSRLRITGRVVRLNSMAPSAGARMPWAPLTAELRPATRARCCWGTINGVVDCMAAQWKMPAEARKNITAKICHNCTLPSEKSATSTTVRTAPSPSAPIITQRRLQRSTRAPANGPSRICGMI